MSRSIVALLLASATLCACGPTRPRLYGATTDLHPLVAAVKGERTPAHVSVSLARPANVAVFFVIPGRAPTLLYPKDSATSEYLEAGTHEVETSIGNRKLLDTARMIQRPRGPITAGPERTGRGPDSSFYYGGATRGFLLVYASEAPIPYSTLVSRVAAYTIPAADAEALSAVTKQIREVAPPGTTPWAAYAIEYP